MPRTYHNGVKGTFMNLETHNRYFRDIGYNTDPAVTWPPAVTDADTTTAADLGNLAFMRGHHSVDQYRIEQLVKRCKHVTAVVDLLKQTGKPLCGVHGKSSLTAINDLSITQER
jgi:hypothetical protein